VGANWGEETPTPAATGPAVAGTDADAFPSIALDVPPPADTPGVDAAETASANRPGDIHAALNVGYAYYKAASYTAAAQAFERAALANSHGGAAAAALPPPSESPSKSAPNAPPTRPGTAATTAFLYEGLSAMGAGDLDTAIDALDRAAKEAGSADPNLASVSYLEIGRCRFQEKRDADARSAFEQSLALDPHQGEAKLGLGTFAALDGNTDKAGRLFTEALATLPTGRGRARALASLGLLAEQNKDRRAALAFYRRAVTQDSTSIAAQAGITRLASGTAPPAHHTPS
jgi:tetratricopeptide (TPR) repeat protein